MALLTRQRLRGALLGFSGVCVLVMCLAALDTRVRGELGRATTRQGPSAEFVDAGKRFDNSARAWIQFAKDESVAHAPMTMLAAAGLVLFIFMLRS